MEVTSKGRRNFSAGEIPRWRGPRMLNSAPARKWNANSGSLQDEQTSDGEKKAFFKNRTDRDGSGMGKACHEVEETSEEITVVKIAPYKVGKVIGKQGVKVRELQSVTETHISVGKECFDGKVEVSITGSLEGREKCREMILELTEEVTLRPFTKRADSEKKKKQATFSPIDWQAISKAADEYHEQRWAKAPPIKKYFYIEDPDVASMSDEYVKELRKSLNHITVTRPFGGTREIPNPVESFSQAFGGYPELLDELNSQGFTKPFPIQCQAWPVLLAGHDMIGVAQTGTGKTLAFLLPGLIHTAGQETPLSERNGPNILVLAPTRELALQIEGEARKFQYCGLKSVCVYGGGERELQVKGIEKGVQIVIATPGRLSDLILSEELSTDFVTYLVLDEADRMLDMGFERQIRSIMYLLRPDRQTVMTSATWPSAIQDLAEKYMKEPVKVVIGSTDLSAVHTVKQLIHIIREEEKFDYLMNVISNLSPNDKIIVFVGKKSTADTLSCDLSLMGIGCQSIHGNRVQSDREQAIDDLKTGFVKILVATDVASRGIDIVDVTKVVNYDFPRNIEEYVHRVGRTGRAGKTGEGISFFTRRDSMHAKELISILEEASQVVPGELRELSNTSKIVSEKFKYGKHHRREGHNFGSGRRYR